MQAVKPTNPTMLAKEGEVHGGHINAAWPQPERWAQYCLASGNEALLSKEPLTATLETASFNLYQSS